jgi:hypothetical protein
MYMDVIYKMILVSASAFFVSVPSSCCDEAFRQEFDRLVNERYLRLAGDYQQKVYQKYTKRFMEAYCQEAEQQVKQALAAQENMYQFRHNLFLEMSKEYQDTRSEFRREIGDAKQMAWEQEGVRNCLDSLKKQEKDLRHKEKDLLREGIRLEAERRRADAQIEELNEVIDITKNDNQKARIEWDKASNRNADLKNQHTRTQVIRMLIDLYTDVLQRIYDAGLLQGEILQNALEHELINQ